MVRFRVIRWLVVAHPYHPVFVVPGLVALLTLATCGAAEFKAAPKLPEPVCAAVRAGVATFGIDAVVQWAREHGYTSTHITRARKCLTKEKS